MPDRPSNSLPPNLPVSDPAAILRYRDGQLASELLASAITHFNFFTWLAAHPKCTLDSIIAHFHFEERPLDVLMTLCRANGLITTNEAGEHELTATASEHLVSNSPWFLGPYYEALKETPATKRFVDVLRGIHEGEDTASDDWHESMQSEEFARNFTELMNCRGLAMGQVLAEALQDALRNRKHILDVGAGSGIYAMTMIASQPHLTGTVVEQSPVDRIAREEIEKRCLAERIGVKSQNMFEPPWPAGADVVLLSNVLHDWGFPEVRVLLEHAFAALPENGLLVIHEAFLDNDKCGPLDVAEYSALLMNITQGKCYTPAEYGGVLKDVGFVPGEYCATTGNRGFMTAVKPTA